MRWNKIPTYMRLVPCSLFSMVLSSRRITSEVAKGLPTIQSIREKRREPAARGTMDKVSKNVFFLVPLVMWGSLYYKPRDQSINLRYCSATV